MNDSKKSFEFNVNMSAGQLALRKNKLRHWITDEVGFGIRSLQPASEDASFRSYYRLVTTDGRPYIVMDAPPEKEDCRPFLAIAMVLRNIGVNAPVIHDLDLDQGFLLLDDFGDTHYLSALNQSNADDLYRDAFSALSLIQSEGPVDEELLALYDYDTLIREMALFDEWLLKGHFHIQLDEDDRQLLDHTYDLLAKAALEQPRVFVHRDYHSRNLMLTGKSNPGILDFQDALIGPVTYDVVSLLKDCYISWPREQVLSWLGNYFSRPAVANIITGVSHQEIVRWFDLMGVQRHLKASGIFARLQHRDGKAGYLKDIPRTLGYILEIASDYPELEPFEEFFLQKVSPQYFPSR